MTFLAVITVHQHDPRPIIGNLRYQSRRADHFALFYSGDCGDMARLREDFPELVIFPCENRDDWGHEKRAQGLEYANEIGVDAVGFFNADDSYGTRYVEEMMARIEAGADAVYCEWSGVRGCVFSLGSSTSGNYIVRTNVGMQAGYVDRHYEADGTFIERIKGVTPNIDRVDELLYFHNHQ